MPKSQKASLLKKANKLGIPTFGSPNATELQHRIDNWKSGKGTLARRRYQKALPSWAGTIPNDKLLWLPNTSFSTKLLRSGAFVIIGSSNEPPKDCMIVDRVDE